MTEDFQDNQDKRQLLTALFQYGKYQHVMKTGSESVPNGCPCGYFGDPKHECRCTPIQIQRYRNRISGPLLDRIDIHIEVPAIRYQELSSIGTGEPSAAIRERIFAARKIQQNRFKSLRKVLCNAAMRSKDLQKYCELKPDGQDLLKMAITDLHFSARAYLSRRSPAAAGRRRMTVF